MTTDPIAAARALIAAHPDLLFRCDLCPDECNCHPHHDMSMSGGNILCDGCEDFDAAATPPDPLMLIASLADALDAERAKVAAAYEAAASIARSHIYYDSAGSGFREDEFDNTIRALAPADAQAALDKMLAEALEIERAKVAAAFAMQDAGYSITTPADAQAALNKLLAEARLEGWRAGRDASAKIVDETAKYHMTDPDDIEVVRMTAAEIRTLPEPKEASHD